MTGTGSASRRPGRAANITGWVLQALIGGTFLLSAYLKLSGDPRSVAGFRAMGVGDWFRYLIGLLELAGGVGVLVPILSGLASLGLVGLMVGAVTVQLFSAEPATAAVPAVFLVLAAAIAWIRRQRTAQLLNVMGGMFRQQG